MITGSSRNTTTSRIRDMNFTRLVMPARLEIVKRIMEKQARWPVLCASSMLGGQIAGASSRSFEPAPGR